nr:DarT ssDNA thymidine ADP-ribosyltransferase family protein [Actinomadura sp. KC345]
MTTSWLTPRISGIVPGTIHGSCISHIWTISRRSRVRGLRSDKGRRPGVRECGQPSIKERRGKRPVPVPPGGAVADYAPFYFAARSPMLRSILGGKVERYDRDQTHLIYLVTRLSKVVGAGLYWVATDRNAVLDTAKFTSDA